MCNSHHRFSNPYQRLYTYMHVLIMYKDQDQYGVLVHRIVLELQIFNYWSLRETPLSHMRMFMYNYVRRKEQNILCTFARICKRFDKRKTESTLLLHGG